MAIHWGTHIPQAMQRHTGSVKDGASKPPQSETRPPLPLVPEYGDPLWLPPVRPEEAERGNSRAAK
jgi:hypothetical protein